MLNNTSSSFEGLDNYCTKHDHPVYSDRPCPVDYYRLGDAAPIPNDVIFITQENKVMVCLIAELSLNSVDKKLADSDHYANLRIVYSHKCGWIETWTNKNKCAFRLRLVGGGTHTCNINESHPIHNELSLSPNAHRFVSPT